MMTTNYDAMMPANYDGMTVANYATKVADIGRNRIAMIKDMSFVESCVFFAWPDGAFCGNEIHPERRNASGGNLKTCSHECAEGHRRNLRRVNDSAYKARRRVQDRNATT